MGLWKKLQALILGKSYPNASLNPSEGKEKENKPINF